MKTNICVQEHRCALHRFVADRAADRDEDRRAQNQRQWNHIIAGAEVNGDSLDYDGPLTWA
jgi:hypothetical protein